MKTTFTLLFLLVLFCAGTSFAQWSYSYDEYDSASVDSSSNLHVSVQVDGTTYGSCWANGGTYEFPGCPATHQSSVHNVLNNTTQGTTTSGGGDGLGNYYGPSYDMFDYISDQYDTYLFWNVGDNMTSSLQAQVYCAAAAALIFEISQTHNFSDVFHISGPSSITDGQTASWMGVVTSGNATSYQWSFGGVPSGAANSPKVTFSAPTSANTNSDSHWYAYPDNPCSASAVSYYKVNLSVKFTDLTGPITTNPSYYGVSAGPDTGGVTDPNSNDITGMPAMSVDQSGTWTITGVGNMGRKVPTTYTLYVPQPGSQFINKLTAHEQTHVNQWLEGTGHLFGDLWLVSTFYSQIQNFTSTSQADLINQVNNAKTRFFNAQGLIYQSRGQQAEQEAYAVSDPITPQYVYQQSCGRTN